MRTLEQVIEQHPFPLPAPLKGFMQLEQLQMQDIVKGAMWRRCLLDLPVGYGKTVIATAISLMLEPETTVILVPPILIVQWAQWLNSIAGTGSVVAYAGTPKQREELKVRGTRWLIMSYAIFRNDFERLQKELNGREVLTIVDEAQALKGRGKLFGAVTQFTAGNRDLILMSGTIMSQPGDAYAYVKLNTPDIYRSYSMFENIHVAERNIFKQVTKWQDLDLVQANLNVRRVKRTKEEVHAALPKAIWTPIYYDLPSDHMKLYKRLMEEQLLLLDDGSKIDATTSTRLYHAAQQIITNYGYYAGDDTKRSAVFDLIDTVRDEIGLGDDGSSKLILWTIYKKTSAAVLASGNEYLARRKDGSYSVAAYGDADSKKSIAAFLADPRAVELTAQPGSAGAGLNPQYVCWNSAFIEFPTTTVPFEQSAGRIDRKGQKYNPNQRLFIARGTIQERLLKSLFDNDSLVQQTAGTRQGIKNMIFP